MRWSKLVCLCWCVVWAIAACTSREPIGTAGNDASSTTSGSGGTTGASGSMGNAGTSTAGAGGNGGVAGTAGASGAAGEGGASGTAGVGGAAGQGGAAGGAAGGAGTGGMGHDASADIGEAGKGGTAGMASGGASGTGGNGGAGGSGAGAGGSTFDGGAVPCVVDQDCPPPPCNTPICPEALCVMGDGLHYCVTRVHPALDVCSPNAPVTCCTDDSQCGPPPRSHCIPHFYNHCAGPPPLPGNACENDLCSSDFDCTSQPNGFCTAGYPRRCVYGPCRQSSDCNQRSGGRCAMVRVFQPSWCWREAAFCRYADDPCQSDADCRLDGASAVCVPRDDLQGTRCMAIGPPPP
jgi:hypothetical protein